MNKMRLLCLTLACCSMAPAQDTVIRTESRVVLVDAVVTDKKGGYIRDLKQKDFRVWEDNKEQAITSFTFEADAASPANDRKHYLVLFFDNSTSSPQDQIRARAAATKFVETNAGKNRLMSIVEFSGGLRVAQNFTDDADRLKQVIGGAKFSSMSPNAGPGALRSLAVRSVLLALRDLAKGMSNVPGRKQVIFFSGGFPLNEEGYTELTATIDACNHANVAIYPIDIRGLVAPGASLNRPLLQLASYQGRGGGRSGGGTTGISNTPPASSRTISNPATSGRGIIMPPVVTGIANYQQVLYSLANGTGGMVIVNSNDMLAGLEKIGKEQNEYYLLGYTPSKELEPGACHTIKVKVDQSGTVVRARSGYCDVKQKDILAGTPTERDLENRAKGTGPGNVKASMQAPFVYVSSGTARVDLMMDIPAEAMLFNKEKGKFRMAMNVIGVVYLPDGSVAARFSDTVKRDFEDKKEADAFHKTTYHYEKQFEVAAGKYTLKVAFGSGGDNFGKLELPLNIEPYVNTQFTISGLVLSKSVHASEEASAFLEDRVPLVVNNMEIIPSGSNHFTKAERSIVYGEVYEPEFLAEEQKPQFALAIQMQIVERATKSVKFDSGLIRVDTKPTPGSPMVPFGLKMDLTTLAPGSYYVLIGAGDTAGRKFIRTADFELDN